MKNLFKIILPLSFNLVACATTIDRGEADADKKPSKSNSNTTDETPDAECEALTDKTQLLYFTLLDGKENPLNLYGPQNDFLGRKPKIQRVGIDARAGGFDTLLIKSCAGLKFEAFDLTRDGERVSHVAWNGIDKFETEVTYIHPGDSSLYEFTTPSAVNLIQANRFKDSNTVVIRFPRALGKVGDDYIAEGYAFTFDRIRFADGSLPNNLSMAVMAHRGDLNGDGVITQMEDAVDPYLVFLGTEAVLPVNPSNPLHVALDLNQNGNIRGSDIRDVDADESDIRTIIYGYFMNLVQDASSVVSLLNAELP